ncbi:beta-galactosidase GalB [Pedobacter sp. MW01-1-1]|uniref:beta-galactosidase GalB n=1 Tax=Pedobacter sp. MW01-1-1 TaxID=3383027 RepID=UPI003FEEA22F
MNYFRYRSTLFFLLIYTLAVNFYSYAQIKGSAKAPVRERINLNAGWKFMRYEGAADKLLYDERPEVLNREDDIVADSKPSQTPFSGTTENVLKKWILPSANEFIKDPSKHYTRPKGNPGADFAFVQNTFDDSKWTSLNLPHDWAAKGPFYKEPDALVGGGMGRLPVQGVAWYRKKINIPVSDTGKSIYLEIDGAMSYAMVWLNGNLVGGWPYGYNSFRLDLSPYIKFGKENQIAIRLDNPSNSSRWYPGSGIYRSVWLTKTNLVQVSQWGTYVRTSHVSSASALIEMDVTVQNKSNANQSIDVITDVFALDEKHAMGKKMGSFPSKKIVLKKGERQTIHAEQEIKNPALWGVYPQQKQNLYVAVTKIFAGNKQVDQYKTRFGIRKIHYDATKGVIVNGQAIKIQGVNQHHDLGALGAAFNKVAAKRQLDKLRELGCNAIRLAHNPPDPELLNLTDEMGFLVIDEVFDCWEKGKTPLDFHLIFPDWHEADTRSFVRRDKNHPSIMAWSFGNEVGEQYTDKEGAALAAKLKAFVKDEDPTRPSTASMNYAKPSMPFAAVMDIISLNYQGEGIRFDPPYAHLQGTKTKPLYGDFHAKFPDKLIISSESASTLSSRGTYIFPVFNGIGAPVSDSTGGNAKKQYVSAYELYTAQFGSSPDKVFMMQDQHPFVGGEFVWTGWDHLGEPTPYYGARSSYSGIIDLAGFEKDRFYLYQARWRPNFPMAHVLPHWTWPGREGQITPVHVFSSGDEAELFVNGKSMGRKKRKEFEYRFRWDDVVYQPGELKVVTYKNGKVWASDQVRTAGKPAKLLLSLDKKELNGDSNDLAFLTVRVLDVDGNLVPEANVLLDFSISGAAEIEATDNGDQTDLRSFSSQQRNAFSGMALAIIKPKGKHKGQAIVRVKADGIAQAEYTLTIQ